MELLTEWTQTVGKNISKVLYLGLHGFSPGYDVILFSDDTMIILRMESGDYHSRDGIVGSYAKFKDEPRQLFEFLVDHDAYPSSIRLEQYSWETEEKFIERQKDNNTSLYT